MEPVEEYVSIREHPDSAGKSWQRVTVGRATGGDGYVALGVRAEGGGEQRREFWTFSHRDLGRPPGRARIALSNVEDGRGGREWAAVFGGGHGAASGRAALFVVFIDRGIDGWANGDFVGIPAGGQGLRDQGENPGSVPTPREQDEDRAGGPAPRDQGEYPPVVNGLGEPALLDVDLDGSADLAYAGDLRGNLYRFDISSGDPSAWRATRLFRAAYGDPPQIRQPITGRPYVAMHPGEGEFLVAFGTGGGATGEDDADPGIQSIYGIWDPGESTPATARPDTRKKRLAERVLVNVVDETAGSFKTRRVLSGKPLRLAKDSPGRTGLYGWYIDLDMPRARETLQGNPNPDTCGRAPPGPQYPGERVTGRAASHGTMLFLATAIPGTGARCAAASAGSVLAIDLFTGSGPESPAVDLNDDGRIDAGDLAPFAGGTPVSGLVMGGEVFSGNPSTPKLVSNRDGSAALLLGAEDEQFSLTVGGPAALRTGRLSWRELPDAPY